MPLQHAVLALLTDGPSYGYELKASFEDAIGPQWGELSIGHLYQILERLVRDRLVTKRVVAQSSRPDKAVYRLTKAGNRELEVWLAQPLSHHGGYRDDFFLKLFAAARLDEGHLRDVIKTQRRGYMEELSTLGRLRDAYGADPMIDLLLEAAVLHTEANLKTLDKAKQHSTSLLRAAEKVRGASSSAADRREQIR